MRTVPSAVELLDIIAEFLRSEPTALSKEAAAFHRRVAANTVDIVRREIELGGDADARTVGHLSVLLGKTGTAAELERDLAAEMAAGRITQETPGLMDHLWQSTLAEVAIDQPNYATYRKEAARRSTL